MHNQNEEQQNEEQKGVRKKRNATLSFARYFLALVAAVVVAYILIAPYLNNDSQNYDYIVGRPVANIDWEGGEFDYFGMTWKWVRVDEKALPSFGIESDEDGNLFCINEFNSSIIDDIEPSDLAVWLGRCFQQTRKTAPAGEHRDYIYESSDDYGEFYKNSLIESCGELTYETFNWGDIKDGRCELLDPVELAEEYFGWNL